MYLKRKLDDKLISWRNETDHKPLIIRGARQVGKTESIRHFAENNYNNVIEINFALEPAYKVITQDGYTADAIIKAISRIDPSKRFIPGHTLIFFDELQEHPDISTSLKSFCQDQRFDVICSGSLLGLHYKKIESNSVGYKTDIELRSLDFEEFLFALGYDERLSSDLKEHIISAKPLDAALMTKMPELFLDYCILGGMPAVIRSYIEKETFEGSLALQKQLLMDYEEDIIKYAEGMDQTRILNVFRHIPVQLAKENKKFQISKVANGARFRDYRGSIEWLQNAGIINICHCLNYPELPLKGNYDESSYKIYMADTGLLVAMLDEESAYDLRVNKNLGTYKGALYENIIADALKKSGYEQLYYYKKENSTLEEDFFVRTADELIPVEVKAKKGSSRSLSTLIKSDSYPDIRHGIKFTSGNIGLENNILTLPHFTAYLLKAALAANTIFK